MAYSTIVKPSVYFNTVLYSGTGSEHTISGVSFQPDWTWLKSRTNGQPHMVSDAVRGGSKQLYPNTNGGETSYSQYLKSFNSDGFVLGTDGGINASGQTYVSWNWKANGQGSSNTAGSINTTYTSVNTTAGFSIVKYTGTGSAATMGHGLGTTPDFIITKKINASNNWFVWSKSLTATQYLVLDTTNAISSASSVFGTLPTSTVYSTGGGNGTGASGDTYISYVFSEKTGYSKFGSYTGNGNSDGPFIYTGFKPAFVMCKKTSGTGAWSMVDNKRPGYNLTNNYLQANDPAQEYVDSSFDTDLLSNGWKARKNNGDFNSSGQTYIYIAFAENPLVANSGTDGVPATAR